MHSLFSEAGGRLSSGGLPCIHPTVGYTVEGTPVLREPGVVVLARPAVDLSGIAPFLDGFDPSLKFPEYLNDPVKLSPGATLTKFAGQLCYASFGEARTTNEDAERYFDNILSSGHGSVMEHAHFAALIYGVGRSETHELVRHRTGVGYSQVSQRYVGGPVLRFVMRREYQGTSMESRVCGYMDATAREYEWRTNELAEMQRGGVESLQGAARTELRKKVRQVARSVLTNETEAPILFSGNIRALRHVCEMRASKHADTAIREGFFRLFLCLREMEPELFQDYRVEELPDGTRGITTPYRKV